MGDAMTLGKEFVAGYLVLAAAIFALCEIAGTLRARRYRRGWDETRALPPARQLPPRPPE